MERTCPVVEESVQVSTRSNHLILGKEILIAHVPIPGLLTCIMFESAMLWVNSQAQ